MHGVPKCRRLFSWGGFSLAARICRVPLRQSGSVTFLYVVLMLITVPG